MTYGYASLNKLEVSNLIIISIIYLYKIEKYLEKNLIQTIATTLFMDGFQLRE